MRRFAPAFVLAVRRLCLAVLAFSMKAGGGVADGGSVVRGPSVRIRDALLTIRGLAREIVEAAADPSRKMSELFSEAAIQGKVGACVELALAVASCRRGKWLRAVCAEIEATADAVIAADNALAPRLTLNPETISHVQCVELKIFDMMISAGPVILILSKLAQMFRPYVIACLHKEFADIRIQLRLSENGGRPAGGRPRGGRQPAFTQKAVAVLCGRSEGTVAGWESGRIRPPLGYGPELRARGGVEFFDWVREYCSHFGVADVFVQIRKGNVAYTEGLTEREKGLVEEYIWRLRQG